MLSTHTTPQQRQIARHVTRPTFQRTKRFAKTMRYVMRVVDLGEERRSVLFC